MRFLRSAVIDPAKGLATTAIQNPSLTGFFGSLASNAIHGQLNEFKKAKDLYDQGRYTESAGHAGAGALPIFGPQAAHIGEQIAGGDYAGAAGSSVPLVLSDPTVAGWVSKGINAVSNPIRTASNRVTLGAFKPSQGTLDMTRAPTKTAAQTQVADILHEHALYPTAGNWGAAKAGDLVDAADQQLSDLVKGNQTPVDPREVIMATRPTFQRLRTQVNPNADVAAASDVVQNFATRPDIGNLTVEQAQAMKRGTYQSLKNSYGERGAAQVEAEKALAAGLNQQISQAVPDAAPLNQQMSRGMIAQRAADEAARRGRQADVVRIGEQIGAAGKNPLSYALGSINRPTAQAFIGQRLYDLSKAVNVPPEILRSALIAQMAGQQGGW